MGSKSGEDRHFFIIYDQSVTQPPVGQSPSAHDFYTHLFPSLLFYTEEKQIRLISVIIDIKISI